MAGTSSAADGGSSALAQRVGVVVNPTKFADLTALESAVARHWSNPQWWQTTAEDPGAGQVQAAIAAGVELVLVCGGDGTVAACAGALAGTGVPMAVVPGGTGNLLARNLGIPLDVEEALAVASTGTDRAIDVLESGERRFVVMAGLGFDAAMIAGTDERLKAKLGWVAYLGGFVRALTGRRRSRLSIVVDSQPPVTRKAIGVLIGNVGQLQAGITLLPDALPDDGLLDLIVLVPRTVRDWPMLAARILLRRPDAGDQAEILRGQQARISADRPLPAEFDGDYTGELAELAVRVLPGALRLRCPNL